MTHPSETVRPCPFRVRAVAGFAEPGLGREPTMWHVVSEEDERVLVATFGPIDPERMAACFVEAWNRRAPSSSAREAGTTAIEQCLHEFDSIAHLKLEQWPELRKAARAELATLRDAQNHAYEALRQLMPCGHDGDEDGGQCDPDCDKCACESAIAHIEATATLRAPARAEVPEEMVERLDALHEKATPGPWKGRDDALSASVIVGGPVIEFARGSGQRQLFMATADGCRENSADERDANTQLVIELRNAWPTIRATLRARRDESRDGH